MSDHAPTTFGLMLFDGVEELDFVGPWEVFTASSMLRDNAGLPADTIVTIAEHDRPVRAGKGLRVLPDHTFGDHPALDLLLVPGGFGTRTEVKNQAALDWIAATAATVAWTTSVCTGSYLLHASGAVPAGTPLATHWGFEDTLEAAGANVERTQRWVADGDAETGWIVSSQGVSAGIDMALWIIGQIYGEQHARDTQHYIQYDPAPPYATT